MLSDAECCAGDPSAAREPRPSEVRVVVRVGMAVEYQDGGRLSEGTVVEVGPLGVWIYPEAEQSAPYEPRAYVVGRRYDEFWIVPHRPSESV